ncbi:MULTISPECIES: replication initiator protein A, partial [Arsenophonus]
GNQHEFVISLEKLHLKTGSTALLKMFRHNLKQLAQTNDLPDYEVLYDSSSDKVTFKNRNQNTPKAEVSRMREKGKKEIFKLKNALVAK